jgi:conjugative transfer signal peptidase TraF
VVERKPPQSPGAARRRRWRIGALAGLAGAALALPLALVPAPWLVWNASASVPLGLYRVGTRAPLEPGDTVVAWLPPAARALAGHRGYLPVAVPAVKRVAATAGARVCARGANVAIDGRLVATRLAADRRGRPLTWWNGCRTLAPGEIFLLVPQSADSFDGRYFGPSRAADVIGRAYLLWVPGAPRGAARREGDRP